MFDENGMKLMSIGPGKSYASALWAAMTEVAMATGYNPFPYALRKPEKTYKTCLLHSCTNRTNHNGGYCCADHCKRHRAVTKILLKHKIKKENRRLVFIGCRSIQ